MKARSVIILLFVLILSTASVPVFAQTTPTPPTELFPGDIAIIGFNFVNPDDFTIVVLKDIPTLTQVYFTDKGWGWNSTLDIYEFIFKPGDTTFDYWIPAGTKAGTVIRFLSSPTTEEFTLNDQGDQLFVYTKSDSQPLRVIFGLNSSGTDWQVNLIDDRTSPLPPGLDATTSLAFDHTIPPPRFRNANFIGRSFTSPSAALAAIVKLSNWETSDAHLSLNTDPFIFSTTNVDLEKINASQKSLLSNPFVIILIIFGLILSSKLLARRSKI